MSNTDEKYQMLPSLTMPNDPEQTQKNSNRKPPKSYHILDQTRSPNTRSRPPGVRTMTIFIRGTNRDGHTFMIPIFLQTIYAFTHPLQERLLNDPTTPLKTPFTATPINHPCPPHKKFYCTSNTPKDHKAPVPPLRPKTIGHNPLTTTTLPSHHLFYYLGLDTRKV